VIAEAQAVFPGTYVARDFDVYQVKRGSATVRSTTRAAGLVKVRSEGKQTFYSLNQEAIASCCGNLIQVFAPESNAAQAIQDLE
jgi:hypothetical protein